MRTMQARRWALAVTALAITTTVLAGCGGGNTTAGQASGGGAGYGAAASTTAAPAPTGSDLGTASTDLGTIVVDGKGMTLYYFTQDSQGTDTSACTGECLDAWPIAKASAQKPTAQDVSGKIGTIAAADGGRQLTLDGRPLYYFAQDKAPGDTLGQGLNGLWYVAAPDGALVTAAPTSSGGY